MNKSTSIVYMCTFLVIILGFSIATVIIPDRKFSTSENRTLSTLPTIRVDSLISRSFFEDMNQYLNDQIVFRDGMVKLYQRQQNSKIFNAMLFENMLHTNSPLKPEDGTEVKESRIVSKLVLTNNKWMFPIPSKVVYTKHIDVSTTKLNEAIKFAEEQGTETYFVSNPSRTKALMHLYPTYLRTDSYAKSKEYFLSKLDNNINVVNVGNKFDTFTKAELEEMYLETDHHWNIKGAFTAYQEMITQISNRSPIFEDEPMTLDEINISQLVDGRFEGSYNNQINFVINPKKADRTIIYEPKIPFAFSNFEVINKDGTQTITDFNDFYGFKRGRSTYAYGTIYGGDRQRIAYENPQANNQLNVLLLKDSFMNPLTPYLAQHFNKLTVLDNRYYSEFSLQNVLTTEHYDMLIIAFHDDNLFSGNYEFEKKNDN
ncbi:DHHW family protein [Paenibacillus endoradicis]|uniref:DHHW family protein n=1 Tax=Paenibacillus endoradicis TaxID=2972487 RepID=UPI002158F2F4|nr:DHHW family protein [Paenibacillus endoradicis]MCR8656491.1 DHHW family protein [Paenibacillus endoradicis]